MTFSKGNVFTALDADNVRPGTRVLVADTIDLLKQQVNDYDSDEHDVAEPATVVKILDECYSKRFRVKFDSIDKEYDFPLVHVIPYNARPFNDLSELVNFWDKYLQKERRPPFTLPFIWTVSEGAHLLITGFSKNQNSVLVGKEWHSLEYMFDNFTFEDGRPFGVVINDTQHQ